METRLSGVSIYKLNDAVTVIVNNRPVTIETIGEMGYAADVTIKISTEFMGKELRFSTVGEIAEFMANIKYDEPQGRVI